MHRQAQSMSSSTGDHSKSSSISGGVAASSTTAATATSANLQTSQKAPQTRDVRLLERLGWLPWQLRVSDNATVNRYRFVPAAIVNHVCLGGVFAWSMFNEPITRLSGVLAPAAGDWLLSSTSATRKPSKRAQLPTLFALLICLLSLRFRSDVLAGDGRFCLGCVHRQVS
jgi:hypothetical protein